MIGGAGANTIRGDAGPDVILPKGGRDQVYGGFRAVCDWGQPSSRGERCTIDENTNMSRRNGRTAGM